MEHLIIDKASNDEVIRKLVTLDLSSNWKVSINKVNNKRSISQNSALHLFFKHISIELDRLGITFNFRGLKGLEMEINYTEYLVKETIWRPIQRTLFDIDSTTELETSQINTILDILVKFFAEKGIQISFPSQIDLMIKQFEEKGYY